MNKKILSKKDAMIYSKMGVTHAFKLNGEGIKDSELKRMVIENPPTIERCNKHVHVYGAFAIDVAMVIKKIMEKQGFDVNLSNDDKEDTFYVSYDSKTHSDEYIESSFTMNLGDIFETISDYIDDVLRRIA